MRIRFAMLLMEGMILSMGCATAVSLSQETTLEGALAGTSAFLMLSLAYLSFLPIKRGYESLETYGKPSGTTLRGISIPPTYRTK